LLGSASAITQLAPSSCRRPSAVSITCLATAERCEFLAVDTGRSLLRDLRYAASGRSEQKSSAHRLEDKVAQRAIVMVLELIYEQDFLPCSFGFRPRRLAPIRQSRRNVGSYRSTLAKTPIKTAARDHRAQIGSAAGRSPEAAETAGSMVSVIFSARRLTPCHAVHRAVVADFLVTQIDDASLLQKTLTG